MMKVFCKEIYISCRKIVLSDCGYSLVLHRQSDETPGHVHALQTPCSNDPGWALFPAWRISARTHQALKGDSLRTRRFALSTVISGRLIVLGLGKAKIQGLCRRGVNTIATRSTHIGDYHA